MTGKIILLSICALAMPAWAADSTPPATAPAPTSPGAPRARKVEKPPNFIPASTDPNMGDWQGAAPGIVAQVSISGKGDVAATLLKSFDTENNLIAVLKGTKTSGGYSFAGDGWTATIDNGHFTGSKADQKFDLSHVVRTSPTLGATPPAGAIVLFDGQNFDAWAKKAGKDWLAEDGPAKWKLVDGGAMEVVPGADFLISHQKFKDYHLHVEFRTLGSPTNSAVFLESRYEVKINDTYGRQDGLAVGGFGNCVLNNRPKIRASYPPLVWQTFDIDFKAPRFDASKKTANPTATVLLNGVKLYDNQELDPPNQAAARLGEAPTGPILLEEHGMPLQFRNIWLVENKTPDAAAMNEGK